MALQRLPPSLRVAAAALLFALVAAPFAYRFVDYAVDDFFITYRYADNLADGDGLVFNPGERVFGTTAAGLALLLAAGNGVTGVAIPRLATALTWLSLVALATLLFTEAHQRRRGAEAIAGGLLVVSSLFVWLHNGSEIHPALLMLAGAAALAHLDRPRSDATAGVLAGFVAWLRPDAVLGTGIVGVLAWWRRRRLPWVYGVVAAVLLAAGLAAAWAWFGDALPVTLGAKRLQARWQPGTWPSGLAFWPAAARHVGAYSAGRMLWPIVAVGALGLVPMLRQGGPAMRALVLYAAALFVAYPLLGVPLYPWYALPLLVVLLYGYAFAAGAAARWLWRLASERGWPRLAAGALAAVVVAAAAWPIAVEPGQRSLRTARTGVYPIHTWNYRDAGEAIERFTEPGTVVAAVEVGTLGYHSDRPIHDLLGLVSPSALPGVAAGDLAAAFRAGDPDLFV
ncbi:MAG TPA: hypothetical protein VKU40_13830, partial [Thermoanaerobaculia bacterium]|nr:hypothetical protein [Thermoanaerobaculia bacterium]